MVSELLSYIFCLLMMFLIRVWNDHWLILNINESFLHIKMIRFSTQIGIFGKKCGMESLEGNFYCCEIACWFYSWHFIWRKLINFVMTLNLSMWLILSIFQYFHRNRSNGEIDRNSKILSSSSLLQIFLKVS